jgi:hypothetical protein
MLNPEIENSNDELCNSIANTRDLFRKVFEVDDTKEYYRKKLEKKFVY